MVLAPPAEDAQNTPSVGMILQLLEVEGSTNLNRLGQGNVLAGFRLDQPQLAARLGAAAAWPGAAHKRDELFVRRPGRFMVKSFAIGEPCQGAAVTRHAADRSLVRHRDLAP